MVNSLAPCSCNASSRLSAPPTAPNPATSTVEPSLTPNTASAVVFTCLSITPKNSLPREANTSPTGSLQKIQNCSGGPHLPRPHRQKSVLQSRRAVPLIGITRKYGGGFACRQS